MKKDKRLENLRPFKPGQSGNPAGRPKSNAGRRLFREVAQEHTPEAIETILHLMRTAEAEGVRKDCAMFVIEHGYGKPTAYSEVTVTRPIKQMSREELMEIASTARQEEGADSHVH